MKRPLYDNAAVTALMPNGLLQHEFSKALAHTASVQDALTNARAYDKADPRTLLTRIHGISKDHASDQRTPVRNVWAQLRPYLNEQELRDGVVGTLPSFHDKYLHLNLDQGHTGALTYAINQGAQLHLLADQQPAHKEPYTPDTRKERLKEALSDRERKRIVLGNLSLIAAQPQQHVPDITRGSLYDIMHGHNIKQEITERARRELNALPRETIKKYVHEPQGDLFA